jgi:hypothetical protein
MKGAIGKLLTEALDVLRWLRWRFSGAGRDLHAHGVPLVRSRRRPVRCACPDLTDDEFEAELANWHLVPPGE